MKQPRNVIDSAWLTQDMTTAREEEFGIKGRPGATEQWPHKYFRYDVVTIAPDKQETPRAPKYCATPNGAAAMDTVLGNDLPEYPCKLRNAPAMSLTAGWSDSDTVPWAVFEQEPDPSGRDIGKIIVGVNGGILLDFYNHGKEPNWARNSCELEILDAYARAGLKPALSQDQREEIMAKP